MAGHRGDTPPSDEECVALLEQDVNGEIDALIGLLNTFRQVLIKRQPTANDRATWKRKPMPRKAPQPRKANKPKRA
jgi:hypothetical protein